MLACLACSSIVGTTPADFWFGRTFRLDHLENVQHLLLTQLMVRRRRFLVHATSGSREEFLPMDKEQSQTWRTDWDIKLTTSSCWFRSVRSAGVSYSAMLTLCFHGVEPAVGAASLD